MQTQCNSNSRSCFRPVAGFTQINKVIVRCNKRRLSKLFICTWMVQCCLLSSVSAEQIVAGVGKVEITDRTNKMVNDPLYAKALVIKSDASQLVIVTVDAVAIGGIGYIRNDFLANVRARLKTDLNIAPEQFDPRHQHRRSRDNGLH